jgi:hypothetical protein
MGEKASEGGDSVSDANDVAYRSQLFFEPGAPPFPFIQAEIQSSDTCTRKERGKRTKFQIQPDSGEPKAATHLRIIHNKPTFYR